MNQRTVPTVAIGVLVVVLALATAVPFITGANSQTATTSTSIPDRTTDTVTGANGARAEEVTDARNASTTRVADRNATDTTHDITNTTADVAADTDATTANDTARANDTTTGDATAMGANGKAKVGTDESAGQTDGNAGRTDESAGQTDGNAEGLVVAGLSADEDESDPASLNNEFIVYENTGGTPLNFTGWTVTDSEENTYSFPDRFTLAPGANVTLYTGTGTDTATALYWGRASEVWNDGADTMTVRNANGTVVLQRSYLNG